MTLLGIVACVAGVYGIATGLDGLAGDSAGTVNVDSEYRFFSALWLAYGLVVLRVAPAARHRRRETRVLMAILFVAGLARALSWAVEGRPDALYVALLVLELSFPLLILGMIGRTGRMPPSGRRA